MRIKILVANALLDDDERGGLYEEHDVSDERGEYLISVGAAEEVKAPAKKAAKADEKKAEEPKKSAPAPARRPAPRTK